MTCARNKDSWAGRIWRAAKLLGADAPSAAGVSAARLRQLSNPNRNDSAVLETIFRLDRESGLRGMGAPIYELWRDRLVAAGAIEQSQADRRRRLVEVAVRALRRVVDLLESSLAPSPQLIPARVTA